MGTDTAYIHATVLLHKLCDKFNGGSDIWSGIDDFDVAKDRYLKFCALGDHIPFKEALSEVGIHNVFEEKCSIILAEQITEEFGFDYEDVKHDEWYYNAVFFSLPYVDGIIGC